MRLGRKNSGEGRRVLRKDRTGMAPVKAGAILFVFLLVVVYFGFSKHIPFTHGYRLKAVFESANNLRPGSPVRIAGVNIGKVKQVERAGNTRAAVVTMELEDRALPIHKDATLKIRPRIFLEGNFFVDLKPGTPSAPKLSDSDTVPVTQTATPVQLDEVLTSLQSDARTNLQDVLDNYGAALSQKPTAAQDVGQDPSVQGKTGAQALNSAFKYSAPALRDTAIVNQAVLGTRPGDLSKLVKSFGSVAGALDQNEVQLQDLITNFNVTTGALASQQNNLRLSIRLLAPTLAVANNTLLHLNQAFPATRAFAREILPGVHQTPATIEASFPWIKQTRALLGPKELGGLVKQLQPTTERLANLTDSTIRLLPQADHIAQCLNKVVLPTGDVKLNDGNLSTGVENYKGFWYTLVGLAGEGQNFDGNGMYVRFQPGGGATTVSTGGTNFGGAPLFGNAIAPPIGTRPRYTGKRPPYKPDALCQNQALPDLNGPLAQVRPAETIRSRHASAAAVPEAVASKATAAPSQQTKSSLADELAKRLNPFAGSGAADGVDQKGVTP